MLENSLKDYILKEDILSQMLLMRAEIFKGFVKVILTFELNEKTNGIGQTCANLNCQVVVQS